MVVNLMIAIIIVYLVMAVLFESFVYPLIIMLSVPVATAGGVIGLSLVNLFTFQPLDMLTLLGFVILIGIVVNNAIVLVDCIKQRLVALESDWSGDYTELVVAASVRRFRPILMTSLTTILALLPMAIGFVGGEADVPLARTIVGGVIAATLLPKFVVPCLYVLVKRPKDTTEDLEAAWS